MLVSTFAIHELDVSPSHPSREVTPIDTGHEGLRDEIIVGSRSEFRYLQLCLDID